MSYSSCRVRGTKKTFFSLSRTHDMTNVASFSKVYFCMHPPDIVRFQPVMCNIFIFSKESSSCSVIVRVSVVLKRTVGDSD